MTRESASPAADGMRSACEHVDARRSARRGRGRRSSASISSAPRRIGSSLQGLDGAVAQGGVVAPQQESTSAVTAAAPSMRPARSAIASRTAGLAFRRERIGAAASTLSALPPRRRAAAAARRSDRRRTTRQGRRADAVRPALTSRRRLRRASLDADQRHHVSFTFSSRRPSRCRICGRSGRTARWSAPPRRISSPGMPKTIAADSRSAIVRPPAP